MTHKKCQIPSDNIYQVLHVGKAVSSDLGYPGDDTGDNISDLNSLFGELTGVYWVWKNDLSSDIIGVCHYRRFFATPEHKLLTAEDISDMLTDHDIITSMHTVSDMSSYESYAVSHNIRDYDILGECIHRLTPEYDDSFEWRKQEKGGYFGNLAIMPRPVFDSYCSWMFEILSDASEYIDVSGYDLYHRRVYGFLSEILMNIWIHHNNVNVYECPVIFTSEKAETMELKKAIAALIRESRIKEARSLYYDITKIRPDVLLPESDISGELLLIEQILFIMDKESDQNIAGLLEVSDDLNDILTYYKTYADILKRIDSGSVSPEDKEAFETSHISPVAAEVIRNLWK